MVVGFQENDLDKLDSVIKSDTHKDISLEMQTENNLREENIELQRYVSVTKDLFCIFSFGGKIIKINRAWRESLGYNDSQMIGKSIFEIIVNDDVYATKFAISESVKSGGLDKFVNRVLNHKGIVHYYEWRVKVFENSIYASGRDISDLIMTREKLEYYHNRDALTGMYQRSFIQSSSEAMVLPYQLPLSVIFVDLNGLKLINDSYGHDQGDELLRTISQKMLSYQREGDIFVRYGGDEFVFCLFSSFFSSFLLSSCLVSCFSNNSFSFSSISFFNFSASSLCPLLSSLFAHPCSNSTSFAEFKIDNVVFLLSSPSSFSSIFF